MDEMPGLIRIPGKWFSSEIVVNKDFSILKAICEEPSYGPQKIPFQTAKEFILRCLFEFGHFRIRFHPLAGKWGTEYLVSVRLLKQVPAVKNPEKYHKKSAYLNWCGRGRPDNDSWVDWFKAINLRSCQIKEYARRWWKADGCPSSGYLSYCERIEEVIDAFFCESITTEVGSSKFWQHIKKLNSHSPDKALKALEYIFPGKKNISRSIKAKRVYQCWQAATWKEFYSQFVELVARLPEKIYTRMTNPKVHNVELLYRQCRNSRAHRKRFKFKLNHKSSKGPWNHIQGIVTYGHYSIITYSEKREKYGRIYTLNRRTYQLSKMNTVNNGLNHPGGCQNLGEWLFIAEEPVRGNGSAISLYHLKNMNLSGPKLLNSRIIQRNNKKAGGVGVTNYNIDGHEICLVAAMDGDTVDFYRARVIDLLTPKTIAFTECGSVKISGSISNVCLVTDSFEKIYMFAFRDKGMRNSYLDLYRIHFFGNNHNEISHSKLLYSERIYTDNRRDPGSVSFRWGAGLNIINKKNIKIWVTERRFDRRFTLNSFNFYSP